MEPKRKHYLAQIPTIVLLVLLGLAPQAAILLFILRAIDRSAARKEAARWDPQIQNSAHQTPNPARPAYTPYNYTQPGRPHRRAAHRPRQTAKSKASQRN